LISRKGWDDDTGIAVRFWCRASTREPPLPAWSPTSQGAAGGGDLRLRQQFKDRTAEAARAAGAEVRSERRQARQCGPRMFADIDADIYCWSTAMRPMMRRAPRA